MISAKTHWVITTRGHLTIKRLHATSFCRVCLSEKETGVAENRTLPEVTKRLGYFVLPTAVESVGSNLNDEIMTNPWVALLSSLKYSK